MFALSSQKSYRQENKKEAKETPKNNLPSFGGTDALHSAFSGATPVGVLLLPFQANLRQE
jgi:hypothetical protein